MEYIRVKRRHDYKSMIRPKIHILKADGSFACKLKLKFEYDKVTDVDPALICFRCLDAENIQKIDRKEAFSAFLVKMIKPIMENCDPDKAIESMDQVCSRLTDKFEKHNIKCHFLVESEYCNNIKGRIVFEGKQDMYFKINYKPKRKDRIKFEVNARDYLLMSVEEVFT